MPFVKISSANYRNLQEAARCENRNVSAVANNVLDDWWEGDTDDEGEMLEQTPRQKATVLAFRARPEGSDPS